MIYRLCQYNDKTSSHRARLKFCLIYNSGYWKYGGERDTSFSSSNGDFPSVRSIETFKLELIY